MAEDIGRLADAAHAAHRICMPAMCMRFWPAWLWLAEQVEEEALGKVQSATFHRLGSIPAWSREFYSDESQSGGALVDLHIHDADFVRHCFGDPVSLISTGSVEHLTTCYRFAKGPKHGQSAGTGYAGRIFQWE